MSVKVKVGQRWSWNGAGPWTVKRIIGNGVFFVESTACMALDKKGRPLFRSMWKLAPAEGR